MSGYANSDRVFKILIVDDERNVLVALHNTLKRTKLFKSEIRIAEDGEMAWSEIEKEDFDLVLSDYKMPGMNGIDLLMKVRDKSPGTIRIIITGVSDIDVVKMAINNAAVHLFIDKPWDSKELKTTINQLLRAKNEQESEVPEGSRITNFNVPLAFIPLRLKGI